MKTVTIYTDGACSRNPGPGGYGVVLEHDGRIKELSGAEVLTTNNRMEMTAIIRGLETLKKSCVVHVFSDSRYVVDAINKGWVLRWQNDKWRRSRKGIAKNVDLWERLLQLIEIHKITFNWVPGHSGNEKNERCDTLARQAIKDANFPVPKNTPIVGALFNPQDDDTDEE